MNASPLLRDPLPPPANAVPAGTRAGAGAGVFPPILLPCGGILLAGAIGSSHHSAWTAIALFAAAIGLLAVVARSAGAGLVAITLLALAAGLFRAQPIAERTVIWPTENTNAVRGTVETWSSPNGETVQTPVTVVAVRTKRGWQFATATLRATLPAYPPLNRGDVIVIGGIATLHRNAWPDADGSLYGQWIRIERRDDPSSLTDIRYRAVTRFIAGIERHVRSPEAGLTAGMLLGEKTVLDAPTRDALNATGTTQHMVVTQYRSPYPARMAGMR